MARDAAINGTPPPMSLLLVRSGRTEYDCQSRIQGTLDIPLSADGRQQVLTAAEQIAAQGLAVAALYAGPSVSVQEAAGILGERLGVKPKMIAQLHNLNQGLWQGLLYDEVKAKQPKVFRQWQEHPETVCPPEGESLPEVRERLRAVLAKLAKKHKTGVVAMVVSASLATVLRGLLRDEEVTGFCQPESAAKPQWERLELQVPLAKSS